MPVPLKLMFGPYPLGIPIDHARTKLESLECNQLRILECHTLRRGRAGPAEPPSHWHALPVEQVRSPDHLNATKTQRAAQLRGSYSRQFPQLEASDAAATAAGFPRCGGFLAAESARSGSSGRRVYKNEYLPLTRSDRSPPGDAEASEINLRCMCAIRDGFKHSITARQQAALAS